MVAINFKKEFATDVERGAKRQTIRQSARCKRGDRLQLYTGMRTKSCRKLVDPDPVCRSVRPVTIDRDGTLLDGHVLPADSELALAQLDGFSCTEEFRKFFEQQYGLPFSGVLIQWRPA